MLAKKDRRSTTSSDESDSDSGGKPEYTKGISQAHQLYIAMQYHHKNGLDDDDDKVSHINPDELKRFKKKASKYQKKISSEKVFTSPYNLVQIDNKFERTDHLKCTHNVGLIYV